MVEAIDQAGNVSTPASYTWTVDLVAPTVSITNQEPSNPSNVTSPSVFPYRR